MFKTSLACAALLALGAACSSNKTCPSDELRPDTRAGAREEPGTAETVIPVDPPQQRTIILIPVPEGEIPDEENPEAVLPAPGEGQTGDDPQAPTILLIPIEPDGDGEAPAMPENGGGMQEDVVPEAEADVTSETIMPRDQYHTPRAPDPKDIYF